MFTWCRLITKRYSCVYSKSNNLLVSNVNWMIKKSTGSVAMMQGNEPNGEGIQNAQTNVQYLPSPTKSENDKKEYRVIRLQNGLTALLISDILQDGVQYMEQDNNDYSSEEESDFSSSSGSEDDSQQYDDMIEDCDGRKKSAMKEEKLAALGLCVGVGSFSDPWEIQGMAHFLEHMVFMGSEKYPKENDFDAFIKKRGGEDNAATECEFTTFYFECQEKHLRQAIDKFSQFFISPLMKREAMTREREAIESEFQMSVNSDENRKQQLRCCLAHSENPARKFTWGNLITLQDNISDDELYETVHNFRKRHYSAHRMTLTVQARIPMNTLESWISEYFSSVPNNGLPPDDFKKFENFAFNTPEFKKMYWVRPVKNMCEVELTWALPSTLHLYRSKPDEYVSSLIGHEGKGSLLAYLRKKVWALDISAGNARDGCEHNTMYTLFSITIALTDVGFEHLQEVLSATFGYIKMLQRVGPSEHFFNELKTIAETDFRFAEEVPADEYVENLTESMQFYPPEDYITGSELYFEYDPETIQKCFDALKPDAVNIIVCYKDSGKEFDRVESWFKTEYSVCDIPNDWLETWFNTEPDPSFKMPEQNIFLTTAFNLLPFPEEDSSKMIYPVKIQDDELSEVWYHRDFKFKLPHAFLYFYLISPLPLSSPQNAAMLDLYVGMLNQLLVEELYPANVAELCYSIFPSDKGIVLKLNGFNQKLHLLLEAIVTCMADFENRITLGLFEALKEVQARYYYNNCIKPERLGRDLRFSVLLHVHWNTVDKHAAITKITVATLKAFARQFVEHLYIQSLIQGNISDQQAIDSCKTIVDILKCSPLLLNTLPQVRVSQIPLGEHCCRVKSFNSQDTNSFVSNYYQSGPLSVKSSCIVDFLMMLMEEPVFDVLRTKEQLGYYVYSTLRDTFGILGFSVTVNCQAGKHSVEYVDTRIEEFLKKFSKILKKMREKEVEEVRSSLIKLKQLSDIHLKEEVGRNWSEIISGDYMFDRLEREVLCIQDIKISEIRKWYNDHVLCGNRSNLRKLSVQVVGTADTSKAVKVQKQELQPHRVRKHSKTRQSLPLNDLQKCKCSSIQYGLPVELPLQFITDEDTNVRQNDYFITDIEGFKNGLFIYPINRIY